MVEAVRGSSRHRLPQATRRAEERAKRSALTARTVG
jgi:hypothetical protein